MAFSNDQSRRVRSAVVVVLLIAVISIAAVVLFGGVPAAPKGDAPAGSAQRHAGVQQEGQADGHTMADVDASYGAAAQQLRAKYDANPADPSTLLNLANGYFDWGATAMTHAQGAEDEQHVTDLFNEAIGYYDRYLAEHPGSKSAEVDRAVSIFYAGDRAKAVDTLEAFVAADADFGPAWANLGMFYEADGRVEDARTAYGRAIEADAQNTYNARAYAQQRLDALDGAPAGSSER